MPGTDRLSRRRVYASIAILVGTAFLVLYAGLIFIVETGFFLEIEADSWQVFAALSIACAVVLFLGKQVLGWRETIAALLIFLVLLGFSVAIAGYFIDISWDGRNYHALAVRLLRDGWNPVSDPYHQSGWNTLTWIDHFAKGAWYFSAPIIDLTGNPETGKASNLLLAIVVFCLVFAYLLSYTRVSLPASILISLLPVLNPVISTQLLTRYVDGQVAAIFTILLLLGLFAVHRPDTLQLVAWFAAIVVGINIKFTSAAYTAGLLVLIGAGLFWLKRKDLRSLIPLAITVFFSSLVGLLLVGYNPYVRNTLSFGHPLYPVYGSQAAEIRENIILGANGPEVLRGKDRTFQSLRTVGLSEAERRAGNKLKRGQIIAFSRPTRGFRSGERAKVLGRDRLGNTWVKGKLGPTLLNLRHADRFDVFEASTVSLARGDRIRFTRNGRTADGRRVLRNGADGRLLHEQDGCLGAAPGFRS